MCEQLGQLAGRLGRGAEADRWLGEASALYGEDLDDPSLARTLVARLALATAIGDADAVVARVADLANLRERAQDPEVQAWIDASLALRPTPAVGLAWPRAACVPRGTGRAAPASASKP